MDYKLNTHFFWGINCLFIHFFWGTIISNTHFFWRMLKDAVPKSLHFSKKLFSREQ